jgi:hypothetical protein
LHFDRDLPMTASHPSNTQHPSTGTTHGRSTPQSLPIQHRGQKTRIPNTNRPAARRREPAAFPNRPYSPQQPREESEGMQGIRSVSRDNHDRPMEFGKERYRGTQPSDRGSSDTRQVYGLRSAEGSKASQSHVPLLKGQAEPSATKETRLSRGSNRPRWKGKRGAYMWASILVLGDEWPPARWETRVYAHVQYSTMLPRGTFTLGDSDREPSAESERTSEKGIYS